jgi:hypothetical protein
MARVRGVEQALLACDDFARNFAALTETHPCLLLLA